MGVDVKNCVCSPWKLHRKQGHYQGRTANIRKLSTFQVFADKRMNKISPLLVPNSVASIASLLLTVTFYPKAETNLFCSVFFLKNRYYSLSFQILCPGQNVSQ